MTADKVKNSGSKKKSFEESLERLDKIVGEMEDGELNLEDMIKRFEEGQDLIKFCKKKLNEVEKKVEVLVKKGNAVVAEPLEEYDGDTEDLTEPEDGELF